MIRAIIESPYAGDTETNIIPSERAVGVLGSELKAASTVRQHCSPRPDHSKSLDRSDCHG